MCTYRITFPRISGKIDSVLSFYIIYNNNKANIRTNKKINDDKRNG